MPPTEAIPPSPPHGLLRDALADFSADRRLLRVSALALGIGAASAVVAKALLALIQLITNIATVEPVVPAPGEASNRSTPARRRRSAVDLPTDGRPFPTGPRELALARCRDAG
jgi:hypothetical protein